MQTIVIAGGGTGGHIFSGLAIAEQIQEYYHAEVVFVGAKGKMEEQIVLNYNVKFKSIRIEGFYRSQPLRNVKLPFVLAIGFIQSFRLLMQLKPRVVLGVGGYASLPPVLIAQWLRIPTVVLEQNSIPGLANKILSKRANTVCAGFPNLSNYLQNKNILFTGNPVMKKITLSNKLQKSEFSNFENKYSLDSDTKTIVVLGGSLGAKSINQCILSNYVQTTQRNYSILWQTGKLYYQSIREKVGSNTRNVHITDFISDMNLVYASADVIVSRAGALSVSEIIYVQKPSILIPSPNVPDDHQTHNAQALKDLQAAVVLKDDEKLPVLFLDSLFRVLEDADFRETMLKNLKTLYKANSTEQIAEEVMRCAGKKN